MIIIMKIQLCSYDYVHVIVKLSKLKACGYLCTFYSLWTAIYAVTHSLLANYMTSHVLWAIALGL